MRKNILPWLLSCTSFVLFSTMVSAQSKKDGTRTVASTGVILNRYTSLAASAAAGATTISVTAVTDLSGTAIAGVNPYTTNALAYGDLIMIIKMQGATISTANTLAYGAVSALNNTGQYELRIVQGTVGNTIYMCTGLTSAYAVGGIQRVQVVRIPRLSALTINAGSTVVAPAWNGTTGGIVAVETDGNAVVNGSINVSALGFRGGSVDNSTTGPPGTSGYVNVSATDGGEKGEGIAGYGTDYDVAGRYDRGAPANGGGGGNAHNAGGGGGANGNNANTWTGQGVMIVNAANPLSAWSLDPGYTANSNALTNSSGGGRGGYSYANSDQNATTTAPGNTAWGADFRAERGGLGGRPLTYSATTLFFGGGGGAGDANNSSAQPGGNGGGIIYLLVTGTLSGTGSVVANGATAGNTINTHNDAPGGGGAGGAIRLNVSGSISGITINANGGNGGNQLITSAESEGPGGGGGGGYISSTGSTAATITAGTGGTTSSSALTEFPSNGATAGGTGLYQTAQAFVAAPGVTCFALPVKLTSFEVRKNGNQVQLDWSTSEELNVSVFEVQVSTDGATWTTATTLPANNTASQYEAYLPVPTLTTYYRLMIRDIDNKTDFSQVRVIRAGTAFSTWTSQDKLFVANIPAGQRLLKIFNGSGQLMKTINLQGLQSTSVDLSGWAPGIYYGQTGEHKFRFVK